MVPSLNADGRALSGRELRTSAECHQGRSWKTWASPKAFEKDLIKDRCKLKLESAKIEARGAPGIADHSPAAADAGRRHCSRG